MLQNKIEVLTQLNLKSDYLKSKIEIPTTATSAAQKASTSNNDNIFIVHGHNHEIQQTVARAIEKLGLNPIILGDQPSLGNTVIEKFEKYSDVGFAIVLLTDDDLGKAKMQNDLNKRARQNVIMELGFFFGKLGRGRVLPLYMEGVELPSDINGLVFTAIDTSGRWQFEIVKELKALGYDVDANKLL
jgi:predicted nucleotide-binding protein